jgi:AcrR family transcriptional regulator
MASKNITKELIFAESLSLIKEGGMAALSMRNLAGRLGIKAPSLYVHIQSKAELILLLQAHTFKTNQLVGSLNPDVLTWQELLFAIMKNMRKFFHQYPWLFELFASFQSNSDESRDTFEMQAAGFKLHHAGYIGRVMREFVIGHVTFEKNSILNTRKHPLLPENIKPEFTNNLEFYSNLVDNGHEEIFIFGAKLIIKGAEQILKENQVATNSN